VWGIGGIAPEFLTIALDGGEWSFSHPYHLISGKIFTGTICVGGWVDLSARLDVGRSEKSVRNPNLTLLISSP
jgi:hypothetical protein